MVDHSEYRRKFLVVIDETPECDRALTFAAYRTKRTGGTVVLMSIVEPPGFVGLGVEDVLRAEADNLVGIYAALSDKTKADVIAEFGGKGWGTFKPALAELAVTVLAPMANEMRRLIDDTTAIDAVLRDGAERGSVIAEATMKDVRRIVGFIR